MQHYLSDSELYYISQDNINKDILILQGDESKHIQKVMRHTQGENLFVTNGDGVIFNVVITELKKNEIICKIVETIKYSNEYENLIVCIPRLKSQDRFEFALEKCIELGITRFVIFDAERSVARGAKLDRWNKIALAAMKQSLRSFKPQIEYEKSLSEILKREGRIIYFNQTADKKLSDQVKEIRYKESVFLLFGPEGGLSEKELVLLHDYDSYQLTENRLRAETAVVTAVSLFTAS